MSTVMVHPLPMRLPANIVYDSVRVENIAYDPVGRQYTAQVFGVCGDQVLQLVIVTRCAVRRVTEVAITDAEIDAVIAVKPELASDRVGAAMVRAFQRLGALAMETPEAPYNA